jgi:hypothetical protein
MGSEIQSKVMRAQKKNLFVIKPTKSSGLFIDEATATYFVISFEREKSKKWNVLLKNVFGYKY